MLLSKKDEAEITLDDDLNAIIYMMDWIQQSDNEINNETIYDFDYTSEKFDKLKGGSYAAIAPKLEPKKFNKWKKGMLCYLAGMEPYYLKCIKDGPFQPKTAKGDAKPESQWTLDEWRVVVED
ncbi:hypothetical protein Tco_0600317 [Tanacetum coccineum]|uniref:Uncharacterized protein n=1 Tax=Tanacetum coccineum TaxID=301880 RepID=A0ABQ4WBC6_9ASTR